MYIIYTHICICVYMYYIHIVYADARTVCALPLCVLPSAPIK